MTKILIKNNLVQFESYFFYKKGFSRLEKDRPAESDVRSDVSGICTDFAECTPGFLKNRKTHHFEI